MAELDALGVLSLVRRRVNSGCTQKAIVQELHRKCPGVRGISVRSLKRFCAIHNIHATSRLSDKVLDVLVAFGIGIVSYILNLHLLIL